MKVPSDVSVFETVATEWSKISKSVLKGEYTRLSSSHVDRIIDSLAGDLNAGTLSPEYDWESDLFAARTHHESQCEWAALVNEQLSTGKENLLSHADSLMRYSQEIGLAGIKFLLLAHGAVGLGCLAIIGQSSHGYLIAVASVGILCALAGLALTAIGCVILVETGTETSNFIRNKMPFRLSFGKWKALSRVVSNKFQPWWKKGANFIYASVGWFLFYLTGCTLSLFFMQ